MRAKIDINEVEVRTKIRAKYLRAMENEEWGLLPGEIYVRSFLRTYGEFLGLDARQLVDDFRRQYETPADHEPPPIAPPGRERRERERQQRSGPRRRWGVAPWLATTVVLVVVVVGVLYLVGTGGKSSNHTATAPRTAHAGHARHHRARPANRSTTHRVASRPRVVHLALAPTGQIYVCLVNGSGHQLIPGRIYSVGQTIPVQTGAKLLLTLGNNQVTMKANGVTIPIAASASSIGYRFTPTGHSALPVAQQPRCA